MIARITRRYLLLRCLRALWRYHGRLDEHGTAYQVELATALRTQVDATFGGRAFIGTYRFVLRALLGAAIAVAVLAVLLAIGLWQVDPRLALLAVLVALPAALLAWWRIAWGAPLDWLYEHADPDRTIALGELPGRLRELAAETRTISNVPARLADELDALADSGADR